MLYSYSKNPLMAFYHLDSLFLPAELLLEVTDASDGQDSSLASMEVKLQSVFIVFQLVFVLIHAV